ncbi:hypothetical protein Q5752_001934 [Cryptotrichosporon argae]
MLSPVAIAPERPLMSRRGSHQLASSPSMSCMSSRPKRPMSPYLSPHAPFPSVSTLHSHAHAHVAYSPYASGSGSTSPYTSANALHPPYSAPATSSAHLGPALCAAKPRRPGPPLRSTSFCAPARGYTYALASGGTHANMSPEKKRLVAPALERTLSSLGVEGNPSGCTFGITPPTPPLSPAPLPAIFISPTSPPRPSLVTQSSAMTVSSTSTAGPATPVEAEFDERPSPLGRFGLAHGSHLSAALDGVKIRGLDDLVRMHGGGLGGVSEDSEDDDDDEAPGATCAGSDVDMDSVDAVAGKVDALELA